MKKIFAVVLALALALTLMPAAALAAELPPLGAPSELAWGTNGTGETIPGIVRWKLGEHQRHVELKIYNAEDPARPAAQADWFMEADAAADSDHISEDFILESAKLEGGTYYFTVQNLGDGTNYTDGELVKSGEWSWIKPEAGIAVPAAITWDEGGAFTMPSCSDPCFGAYQWELFFSADKADATEADVGTNVLSSLGSSWTYITKTPDPEHLKGQLSDYDIQQGGPGYYYVRIRALSNDITKAVTSDWSPLSTAYNYKDVYKDVKAALDGVADDADAETVRAAVQGIEGLKTAMVADHGEEDGVMARLDALEVQTGVTRTVEVAEGLGDTFAQEDVRFVGAALNDLAEGASQVKLTVAPLAEDTELVIPTLYNDTVVTKFSMDVEGVADTGALKVPVRVTLPVPEHINTAFLVILHYDSQGVPTALTWPEDLWVFQEGGKTLVSFAVDHFSDFVMTEKKRSTALTKEMFTVDTAEATYTGQAITKSVAGADGETKLTQDVDYTVEYTNNIDVGTATITITGKGDYTGKLEYTFQIKQNSQTPADPLRKALTKAMFTVDTKDEVYYNKPITKDITGRDGGRKLVPGTDYTVTYQKNNKVGTALITITGKGDYTGSLEYTFAILKGAYVAGGGSPLGGGGGTPATGGTPAVGDTAAGNVAQGDTAVPVETAVKRGSEVFGDVIQGSWYEPGVTFVAHKGLFQGVAAGVFDPGGEMTRAMLMTVLARMDGEDTKGGDTWYQKGMDWAVAQGISDGTMAEANVTREQLVTMLYRYAKAETAGSGLDVFTDVSAVSDWAKAAMEWAVSQGILTGKDGGRLDPQGTATRAEVATILQRFADKT